MTHVQRNAPQASGPAIYFRPPVGNLHFPLLTEEAAPVYRWMWGARTVTGAGTDGQLIGPRTDEGKRRWGADRVNRATTRPRFLPSAAAVRPLPSRLRAGSSPSPSRGASRRPPLAISRPPTTSLVSALVARSRPSAICSRAKRRPRTRAAACRPLTDFSATNCATPAPRRAPCF